MNGSKDVILRIPKSVEEDTLGYRDQVKRFLDGRTSPVAFRAYRVPMGIYEQRASGTYMVRIRIGAGQVLPSQLERVARLSKTYGNGIVHVTTRQDLQIHEVRIEDTPDVLEGLLEAGLSSRGGGGNTVRNISACPRAGVCPKEEFDIAPYAIATAEYLLQDRSSFNLPRKYKIAFSGCSADCAFASVADLGFFAHIRDGIKGFSVYGAGGLGSNPAVAVKIEDFVKSREIFKVAEAIKRVFDKYGDRSNKHKARLRYVLARVGAEEFIRLYKKEKEILDTEGLPYEPPEIRNLGSVDGVPDSSDSIDERYSNVSPEKIAGRYTVRLRLRNGDIPADDLEKVFVIAAKYGQDFVRTTQFQDLLITGVAKEDIEKINSELKELSIDTFGDSIPKIVACAGASTCRLGLCLSRGLADAISNEFRQTEMLANDSETVIRISGCPNSCGHHYIGRIGLQGKAKRINGRLMPFYDVLVNAQTVEGQAHLAEKIGTVPAKRVPDLLRQSLREGSIDEDNLRTLTAQYSHINTKLFSEDDYYDFGSNELFSLAGRGPGECGAGVMDVIKVDIDEAKDAIKTVPMSSDNIYRAIVAITRALLVKFGLEPKKDREIFALFSKHLIEPGWVKSQSQQLLDEAIDWHLGEIESIDDLLPLVQDLIQRVEELFLSLDASLQFKAEPIGQNISSKQAEEKKNLIDLRGVVCPLNFVKAKIELENVEIGDVLEVLLDEGEPVQNVPVSFVEQGHKVMAIENLNGHFCVRVRREK